MRSGEGDGEVGRGRVQGTGNAGSERMFCFLYEGPKFFISGILYFSIFYFAPFHVPVYILFSIVNLH